MGIKRIYDACRFWLSINKIEEIEKEIKLQPMTEIKDVKRKDQEYEIHCQQ
ncbi:hypothetical protein ACE1TI_17620 [Alteribacillus sp. JSM 102045]|uniref:hypothetical protein n=1 Tax=Alteribacillus sp. JSM 102045 TaxID=1562101 RepID=UPI0035C0D6E9